jgi:LysM repeat protein
MRDSVARALMGVSAFGAVTCGVAAAVNPFLASGPAVAGITAYASAADPAAYAHHAVFYQKPAVPAAVMPDSYRVRDGDTLSAIAQRFYGTSQAWYYLAKANGISGTIIMTGQVLSLPKPLRSYPAPPPPVPYVTVTSSQVPAGPNTPPVSTAGVLTPAQVGTLWLQAGGPASQEGVAECVANLESGDNPDANNYEDNGGTQTSWGLFQISNGTHLMPVPDIDNALVNTQQAVIKYEANGWLPWTTSGACGG